MNLQNVHYVKIDENGDMVTDAYITNDNIYYLMEETWNFTEEEVRATGFAPVEDSIRDYVNGDNDVDVAPGAIIKNDDGTFTQQWQENTITTLEKRARFMEYKRTNLLFECDWTQLPDSPLSDSDKADWATYRQAVRDISTTINWDTITSSEEVVWPTLPGVPEPDPAIAAAANPFVDEDEDGTPD